jgi:3-oxoacyl-[acyl-carrier protein] reductase
MELAGASALVTGAGRGIGRAITLALARAGVRVGAAARSADELEAVAREAREHGGEVLPVRTDLLVAEDCRNAVEEVARTFGGLQILVNNAGIGLHAPLARTTDEQWDRVLGTNLSGVFRVTRAALPHLTRGGGHIFMISSLAGSNAIENMSAYCASKAALDHLTACLMLEVRHDNVKVTTLAPGSVDTAFGSDAKGAKASPWALQADDLADTVLHLLRTREAALLSRVELRPLRPPRRP